MGGKGRLSNLRKPKIITYSNAYEYFKVMYPNRTEMEEVHDKWLVDKRNGYSVMLENVYLDKKLITGEEYLTFCRDFLHQSVLCHDELLCRDVVLSDYSIEKCKELHMLEISSLNNYRTFCIGVNVKTKVSTTNLLRKQHDNINIVYTMSEYIDERLSMHE